MLDDVVKEAQLWTTYWPLPNEQFIAVAYLGGHGAMPLPLLARP